VRKGLPLEELKQLSLTPEEGFVLSRLDVRLSTDEVSALTGFPPARAAEILARLSETGAVESDAPPREASAVASREPELLPEESAPEEPAPEPSAPDEPPAEELGAEAGAGPPEEAEADDAEQAAVNEAGYRKIYETKFRKMPLGERISAAHVAADGELMALCLDPEAPVLLAILSSPACSLQHVRFSARWHPTTAVLEAIGQRGNLLNDAQVQRMLLRNAHTSELLTRKLLSGRRMLDAYKISVDVDVPEKTRIFARSVLRSKWGTSQGEERAGVICATDGRVLPALAGLTLDGRATSILCARSYTSALFVQNLARFGACPPQLLAHLLRQMVVRRQQHLKNMILQHPNTPMDAKRRM